MSILLSIFLGGGLGALLRFLISEQTNRLFLSSFPFGTIVVNILGAFLMGFVVSYFADKVNISQNIKMFLTIGFLENQLLKTFLYFEKYSLCLQNN